MTREYIETQCRKISANYSSSGVCRFARGGGTLCFIDTSQERNGTRGIAFLRDEMTVCLGSGEPCEIAYSDIKSLQIISSFEDFFADELAVSGEGFDVRISDYSLDKSELKRFIEELCVESRIAGEHRAQAEEYAKIIAQRLSENAFREERSPETRVSELPAPRAENKPEPMFAELPDKDELDEAEKDIWGDTDEFGEIDSFDEFIPEEGIPVITESTIVEIPSEKTITVPEDYKPAPIPDEKINWISGSFFERKHEVSEETPVIAIEELVSENAAEKLQEDVPESSSEGTGEKTKAPFKPIVLYSRGDEEETSSKPGRLKAVKEAERPEEREKADKINEEPENIEPDSETMVRIQNMSREETLSFLAESLSEINGTEAAEPVEDPVSADEPSDDVEGELFDIGADLKTISENSEPPEEEPDDGKLTVEPIWGDIYIKASRNLRELIEGGRLSMEQIETELKDKLLSSARAFANITADKSKVPKVLMPRITELRSAANDIDQYFNSGEDIAERAMFFMMYQMLSYADRIAETPETKERLNDFFRRFGPAGITLSMLDMRV